MARFPSLPEQPHLADVFKRFGRGVWPLCEYHDIVLRGVKADILEGLLEDSAHRVVTPGLASVLAYLRKLTLTPSRMTEADAQAVFEQGVSEQALFDAIAICALFNFMNRLVDGCGVVTSEANLAASRGRHESSIDNPAPYREFARQLGFAPINAGPV